MLKTKAQEKKEILAYLAMIEKHMLNNLNRRPVGAFTLSLEAEVNQAIHDILVEQMIINLKPPKRL